MADSQTPVPVVQLNLKRLSLAELVVQDPLLQEAPLLRAIPAGLRSELLNKGSARRVAAKAPIYRKGDMTGPFFWVLKGEVLLTNDAGVEMARAVKGEFFGESELVVPAPARRWGAVAGTEVDYAEFGTDYVASLLKRLPNLRALLGEVDAARNQATGELDDFLNRW